LIHAAPLNRGGYVAHIVNKKSEMGDFETIWKTPALC
jgi:hypothetical protein